MRKLFAFGCSFTKYPTPTWADIIGKSFDYYENWGQGGGGNFFIFSSVIECLVKNRITSDDTVMVMWSSIVREDRYINNVWHTYGNVYANHFYDNNYIKKYVDNKGFLLRDLSYIYAIKNILEAKKIPYVFLSMMPLTNTNDGEQEILEQDVEKILITYQDTLVSVRPSVFEIVFNFNWHNRPYGVMSEDHYNGVAGKDWPSYNDYINKNFSNIDKKILEEMNTFIKRPDPHPTPAEHLEYLDKVLPEYPIDSKIRNWVADVDFRIRNGRGSNTDRFPITRW